MPNGSETDSSSRSDGRASQRNMTLGRTPKISTQTMVHDSYRKETRISTWRTSIEDTQMHHNRRTPKHVHQTNSTPEGTKISLRGCWTLGGGYHDEYHILLSPTQSLRCTLASSNTSDVSTMLPLQQAPHPHKPETTPMHPLCPKAPHCPTRSLMVSKATTTSRPLILLPAPSQPTLDLH
jgi:hypothetical protein